MSLASLYFENNLATISSHPAGYVQLTYHANKYTLEDLRTVLGHTGDLLRRYQWHMLLEDHQQLVSLPAEQQGMMDQCWQQQTSLLGRPLCVATVLAQNVFARLSVAALRQELQTTDINYRSFSDTATASSWMLMQIGRSRLSKLSKSVNQKSPATTKLFLWLAQDATSNRLLELLAA